MKKIKIFSYPWHVSHQYELLKMNPENGCPFNWHYLIQYTRRWSKEARPLPEHLKWVTCYEEGKYDLVVMHIDQQCLDPDIARGKSILFREVKKQVKDTPMICINHGTPVYPEILPQYAEKNGMGNTEQAGIEWAKKKMKELMEGIEVMVVNSYEAEKMWGFGHTIIHGMDKDEWWDLKKEPRIVTVLSPAGMGNRYYGRLLLRDTRQVLAEKYGIKTVWIGEDGHFFKSWNEYRNFLGRSLVYFNPTLGSPMPRSRTEAMLSGCCIVTTENQDADRFIQDGVNGFLVKNNPEHCAKVLAERIFDYKGSVEVGQKGKETAVKLFNWVRFRYDWVKFIREVLNIKI